jgi:acetyl esterase/lipase
MSLDDLPPLPPTVDPRGKAYTERVVAAARKVIATTRCITDVPYRREDYWQKLDIFLPDAPTERSLPVFCFLHGGGWYTGHKEWVSFMAPAILAAPAIFVTPSYRHAPQAQHPAQLDDCADAVAWVYRNIAAHGGDPERIYLGGHSAGAHLAALTTLRRDALSGRDLPHDVIKACFPVSGRFDLGERSARGIGAAPARDGQTLVEAFVGDPSNLVAASPLHQVKGNKTPFFVAVGSDDLAGFVEQARAFVAALRAEDCAVRYEEFDGYDHFMMNETCSGFDHSWMKGVHAWLRDPPPYGIQTAMADPSMPGAA